MDKLVLSCTIPLGESKQWALWIYINKDTGAIIAGIARYDQKWFKVGWTDKGFERPITVNFGPSKVCIAVDKDGNVAVEPEEILLSAESGDSFTQNRVIRASADNPKYRGVPDGINTGNGYPDGQRVIYRDGPVSQLLTAVEEPPMREIGKGEFAPCTMLTSFELSTGMDIPGKAALFDALVTYFPNEIQDLTKELYKKLKPVPNQE